MNTGAGVNIFAVAVLWAWVPAIFCLFAFLPPRRAVIASFLIGYLFLPEASFQVHTLPVVSKVSLTAVGVLLAVLFFDVGAFLRFRLRLLDIPAVVLCLSPIATSLLNDLGFMDGMSNVVNRTCTWGLAYLIGRIYFTDWAAIRELAIGLVLAGLVYAPLCWWEIRMSPQLHGQIYGYAFQSFRTDSSLFGFRPNVFLVNGLSVTMFMGITSLCAYWLWMSGSARRLGTVPMLAIFAFLLLTTVFCKALGGVILMAGGLGALTLVRWPGVKFPILLLIAAAPIYMVTRASGEWSGQTLVGAAGQLFPEQRVNSLAFRMRMEDLLAERAMDKPWFGWGGWGRSHVYDQYGNDRVLVDGLWIIMLGEYGIVGVASLTLMVLASAFLLWKRVPTRSWTDPACGAAVVLAVAITLYMIDGLFNATFNPIASLCAGAVASMSGVAAIAFAKRRVRAGFPVIPSARFVSSVKDLPYVVAPHQ